MYMYLIRRQKSPVLLDPGTVRTAAITTTPASRPAAGANVGSLGPTTPHSQHCVTPFLVYVSVCDATPTKSYYRRLQSFLRFSTASIVANDRDLRKRCDSVVRRDLDIIIQTTSTA